MAYDRYDAPRDQGNRWSDDDRHSNRDRYSDQNRGWSGSDRGDDRQGGRNERGFFERAGDEIASWFGDDDAERRRRQDEQRDHRSEGGRGGSWSSRDRDDDRSRTMSSSGRYRDEDRNRNITSGDRNRDYDRGYGRDYDRDRSAGPGRYANWNDNRGAFARGGSSERDYDRDWRQEYAGRDFNPSRADREPDRGWSDRYQPMTGDYGRGSGDQDRDRERGSQSPWARDEYRGTSRAGSANWSDRSRNEGSDRMSDQRDPHYQSWRDRHMSDLDRDYDDYRAEHQSKFESDFGGWRERRQQKRGLLAMVSPHMEVVGNDKKHVGTVDKVAGDRLILTKSDPDSGGVHHSLSCSEIDKVEGDKVILDCSADDARKRWRDESRNRALFERDDQGEMGPRNLNRSFEGTYR